MGVINDVFAAIRELLLMQDRIKTIQETNTKLAGMINHVDRRLLRVETYLELHSRPPEQTSLLAPLKYEP